MVFCISSVLLFKYDSIRPSVPVFFLFPLLAVLTVDHTVVDLETIEALYENVGISAHLHTAA